MDSERKSLRNTLSVPDLKRAMLDREAEVTGLEAILARWQAAATEPAERRLASEAVIRRALVRLNASAAGAKRAGAGSAPALLRPHHAAVLLIAGCR